LADQDPDQDQYIAALIQLHQGLERLGPGDASFSRDLLARLPALPPSPRIADLGCGTGAGSLILAAWFNTEIWAVDLARDCLDQLEHRAEAQGLRPLIRTVEADMGHLDWPPACLDLLWSEGAAYTLTFPGALAAWRPLLKVGGLAVISEISWFTDDIPAPVGTYWSQVYPAIASEAENVNRAIAAGFQVLEIHRLPATAWWQNYYHPLKQNLQVHRATTDPVIQAVIQEMDVEMELFERYSDIYGYTVYLLKAI
jgi:ubiquinone/menaquinone biosynthesis C-methylase UbiE